MSSNFYSSDPFEFKSKGIIDDKPCGFSIPARWCDCLGQMAPSFLEFSPWLGRKARVRADWQALDALVTL